jgi:hypothetical protein
MDGTLVQLLQELVNLSSENAALKQQVAERDEHIKALTPAPQNSTEAGDAGHQE